MSILQTEIYKYIYGYMLLQALSDDQARDYLQTGTTDPFQEP